ncbi:uncharacterized protein LOC116414465 [Apis florea]|uniref:uncharacterized protein LOC116414465 n=1 Tax=Apis florea TaxID=7463 RepID=UPI0012FEE7E2|nr:uncharacterized protein LOC116414465 [Apis florea]
MYLNVYFTFLLLGLAIAQASPTEKKEESRGEGLKGEEPKIEQTGEDVDRSKKSVFPHKITGVQHIQRVSNNVQTLNIQPDVKSTNIQFPQPVQTVNIQERQSAQINIQPAVQTLNIQPASQTVQTLSVRGPQSVQTLSIQSPQPVQTLNVQGPPTVQTLGIQPSLQRVQTLSIQAPPQSVQTLNIQPGSQAILNVIPRGQTSANVIAFGPHSSKTVQVFQQTHPGSQTNVNIVQPLLKEPVVEKVTRVEKIVENVPESVVVSEVEKEIVTPVFTEQVVYPQYSSVVVSEPETMAAYIKYPFFKYGKPKIISTVKSKLLVEHPQKVMEVKEHALLHI